jgi:hypothetical protein
MIHNNLSVPRLTLIHNCHGRISIQQDDSSLQQIGPKFKEETNKVLHWGIAVYGAETWTLWQAD